MYKIMPKIYLYILNTYLFLTVLCMSFPCLNQMLVLLPYFRKKLSLKKLKILSICHIFVNLLQKASAFFYLPALKFGEGKENSSWIVFRVKFKVAVIARLRAGMCTSLFVGEAVDGGERVKMESVSSATHFL